MKLQSRLARPVLSVVPLNRSCLRIVSAVRKREFLSSRGALPICRCNHTRNTPISRFHSRGDNSGASAHPSRQATENTLPNMAALHRAADHKTRLDPCGDAVFIHSCLLHVPQVFVSGDRTFAQCALVDRAGQIALSPGSHPGFHQVTHAINLPLTANPHESTRSGESVRHRTRRRSPPRH